MNRIKKIAYVIICALLVNIVPVFAENNIDNVTLETITNIQSIPTENTNFLPVEKLFDYLGMKTEWNTAEQCIYAENAENKIQINLNTNKMWINGACVEIGSVSFEENGTVFVSIQILNEILNHISKFDGITGIVISNGNIVWPTVQPTQTPIAETTQAPTTQPSSTPVWQPTQAPTAQPSSTPVLQPTQTPVAQPSNTPILQPTQAPIVQPTQSPAALSDMEKSVLSLVNKVRSENGLNPLSWADDLANVARAHSKDMIDRNFFSHTNPDGLSPFDRLKNNGISYKSAAENIAYGQKTAEAVMEAWMNSAGHRANILSKNVTEIGVGAVKNQNGTIYWTQVFVSR